MSRHHYTKAIRQQERVQLTHQEKELSTIAKRIRCPEVLSEAEASANETKERRNARLEQKRRHRPKRPEVAGNDRA